MKKIILLIFISVFLSAIELRTLDKQRLFIEEGKIEINIKILNDPRNPGEKSYTVFRKDSKKSIVLFTHKKEKGTVVLKNKNILYIKFKTSDRAIRINPIQRLTGDASYGDILELNFENNYDIQDISKQGDYQVLNLKSKHKNATYHKMNTYLKDNKLAYSELFTYSGKLLKRVHYVFNNKGIIDTYRFSKPKGKKETIVKVLNYKPKKLSNTIFLKSNLKNIYTKLSRM